VSLNFTPIGEGYPQAFDDDSRAATDAASIDMQVANTM
jgi:hypothetical protein